MLPGIADIHVEVDSDDHAALVIIDRSPSRWDGRGLDGCGAVGASTEVTQTWDEGTLLDFEDEVHDWVVVGDVEDGFAGEDFGD